MLWIVAVAFLVPFVMAGVVIGIHAWEHLR
jgi:succinate dehydrogenase / fumarate reductase cytochrome b subunit